MPRRVLVFGATGLTGRLVVAELARQGQPQALGGRDAGRLTALRQELDLPADTATIVVDPRQPESLGALCGPETGVIVNCAGPFTTLGEPVVRAAVTAGVHYLDISGEQGYLARI
ncbi:MAG TPA: saccharopine dehydrogenase NADP-binding domain-containing protein, partial [Chloroflexia bacterium]|nr:saccharopine dehydrogenase NADP-binding domain-containing protein [Chloroflexia bacterium]